MRFVWHRSISRCRAKTHFRDLYAALIPPPNSLSFCICSTLQHGLVYRCIFCSRILRVKNSSMLARKRNEKPRRTVLVPIVCQASTQRFLNKHRIAERAPSTLRSIARLTVFYCSVQFLDSLFISPLSYF